MTNLQTINDNHLRRKSAVPHSDGKTALSILIVENHDDTRLLLKTLFEAKGYQVSESDSGEHAVQTALDNLPNLILMDLTLPQIDGLTAMKLIRERSPLTQNVPVVILSGRAEPAIEVQALSDAMPFW